MVEKALLLDERSRGSTDDVENSGMEEGGSVSVICSVGITVVELEISFEEEFEVERQGPAGLSIKLSVFISKY